MFEYRVGTRGKGLFMDGHLIAGEKPTYSRDDGCVVEEFKPIDGALEAAMGIDIGKAQRAIEAAVQAIESYMNTAENPHDFGDALIALSQAEDALY